MRDVGQSVNAVTMGMMPRCGDRVRPGEGEKGETGDARVWAA